MASNEDAIINGFQELKKELDKANLSLKQEIACLSDKLSDQQGDAKELNKYIKKIDSKIDNNYKNMNKVIEEEVKVLEKTLRKVISSGIEKEIGKINKKIENIKKYALDREKDRDNSYHYFARSHFSSMENKPTLVEDGSTFLAAPDDYVPEHPFSR